jgi:tRNA dimethylallyltransferase
MVEGKKMGEEYKIPLLVIVGPTATGKTKLSILLAQRLEGEIVSADSVQVYRYLDIGSAKPTAEEKKGIPHYMIDIVEPDQSFTVYDYQARAGKHIKEIYSRGRLPILVGGTGLYIKALVDGYAFRGGKHDPSLRARLTKELNTHGKEHLFRKLQKVDPVTGKKLHPNDTKRVIRALEYYCLTGEPISRQKELTGQGGCPYKLTMIGLSMPRGQLYDRINSRVDQMLRRGLLYEVRSLLGRGYPGDLKALQALGYRHMLMFLGKNWDWEKTVATLKQDTRKYAKRQMTWFRADKRISWLDIAENMKFEPFLDGICKRVAGY